MITKEQFKEYKELFLADMREGVNKVLSGELKEYENDFISASAIRAYLQTLGHNDSEFDSNGWDYDFWWTFIINDQGYTIYGSGYNSKCAFCKNEDE